VPLVNVSYCHKPQGSWDPHSQNFKQMKDSLAPTFDTAFAAHLSDLASRGLLNDTLVETVVVDQSGRPNSLVIGRPTEGILA
jgi:hypothetical protein